MADPRYGKFNEDGSVNEPEVSALTGGRIFKEESICEMVSKTVFVRYESHYADRVTDELRAEWRRGAAVELPAVSRKKQDTGE